MIGPLKICLLWVSNEVKDKKNDFVYCMGHFFSSFIYCYYLFTLSLLPIRKEKLLKQQQKITVLCLFLLFFHTNLASKMYTLFFYFILTILDKHKSIHDELIVWFSLFANTSWFVYLNKIISGQYIIPILCAGYIVKLTPHFL